jgi:hypothetical protein
MDFNIIAMTRAFAYHPRKYSRGTSLTLTQLVFRKPDKTALTNAPTCHR